MNESEMIHIQQILSELTRALPDLLRLAKIGLEVELLEAEIELFEDVKETN